jgi:transposase
MRRLSMFRDARSLDHATLEELRRSAMHRLQQGESVSSVAHSIQVHPNTVSKWKSRFASGGLVALASTKAPGPTPKLNARQLARLKKLIVGRNPRQLNFGVALWTLPIVGELITSLFGVVVHQTTVARVLHRLGLTPQKPIRRAFQRDGVEIWNWTQVEFPKIVKRVKRLQATLLFLDETGVHEDHAVGTTWGLRGNTPEVTVRSGRRRVNVISAVSPRGQLWFRCYAGTLTAARFVEYLDALTTDLTKRVVLVLDRHPAHVAALTKRWLHEHRHRIEVHYLPGYAPELNPDEHVWAQLKGMFKSSPLEADESLPQAVDSAMEAIATDRSLVRRFFHHPDVRYVRDALGW